jgi:hypothetical protein
MNLYKGPDDIYKELVEDVPEDSEWLFGLVAFAVIEEKKIEWIHHQTKHNGNKPTIEDINNWYTQVTSGELLRAKDTAQLRLNDYGTDVVELYRADFENEIREGILLSEIRETKKFWPQFVVNLAGGFASALLFAIFLILGTFLYLNDTSPVTLAKNVIDNNTEVKSNE